MDPSGIEIARENALYELALSLRVSSGKQHGDAQLLAHIALRYHTLGIVSLLADADQDRYARCLCLAGQVDGHLRRLDLSADPTHNAASRELPFADALVAADLEGAREIARLAPDRHQEGVEYEDDFLRIKFMHQLLLAPNDQAALQSTLDRWDQVAEGAPSEYHALSLSLLRRDDSAFDEAIHAVLDRRRGKLAEWRMTPNYRLESDATDGGLFVFGLACLRLAELVGISTQPDYEGMPEPARIPLGRKPLAPNSWMIPGRVI
jgi:hypothetical protein